VLGPDTWWETLASRFLATGLNHERPTASCMWTRETWGGVFNHQMNGERSERLLGRFFETWCHCRNDVSEDICDAGGKAGGET
jgi:hypothetical protein